MKTSLILAFAMAFIAACTNQNSEEKNEVNDPQIVGGDEDEHGCKPSAGYQWSEIRKDCIRLFETGIRLNPVDKSLEQSLSAFVVFAADSSMQQQVELFVPSNQHSVFLTKKETGLEWENEAYVLALEKNKYMLMTKKQSVLYESEMP